MNFYNADCERIAIENPTPMKKLLDCQHIPKQYSRMNMGIRTAKTYLSMAQGVTYVNADKSINAACALYQWRL